MCVIAVCEVCLFERARASDAFGHGVARHFQMDSSGPCSLGSMDGEEGFDFAHDRLEGSCFVSVGGSDGVSVHGVADPEDVASFPSESSEQGGESLADVLSSHADDEGDASCEVVGVENVEQAQEFVALGVGAAFDAERIVDAAQELGVRAFGRAGALPEPKQVSGAIVVFAVDAVLSGEGFFVVEEERFVAGVEVGFAHLGDGLGGDPAGFHEGDGFGDALSDVAIGDMRRTFFDEVVRPLVDFVQIGEASLGEGTQQVERS